ncbi:MAG: KpsF/GutQ family sugar-phosphate isomerase [Planctomycetota bacterium]|nr:KpsF/GutQ family sugar-phosphate isomerase [Planctomycetota bacterium]
METEADAVRAVAARLDDRFSKAVEAVLTCRGRVVVTGIGKAGLVGRKIAATFASTGTPAFFLHPAEAMHGDLGMVRPDDIVLALSNSGESEEITRLVPYLRKIGVRLVAVTSRADSTLGRYSDIAIETGDIGEACPIGLAPTASTLAMLAIGDALASCALEARGFTAGDYAKLHPGGSLGRRLLKASDLMRTGDRLPLVNADTTVAGALEALTRARAGAAIVVDSATRLLGIFTDGDFRRHWSKNPNIGPERVGDHMTSPCLSVGPDTLVSEAQELMGRRHVNALPVVDADRRVIGLLDIQDIVRWPAL